MAKKLTRYRETNFGMLVATTALVAGYDMPSIRLVMDVGAVKPLLLDDVQKASRGGRDGRFSKMIILPITGERKPFIASAVGTSEPMLHDSLVHGGALQAWTIRYGPSPRKCIREELSIFCDGVGRPCHQEHNVVLCAVCRGGSSMERGSQTAFHQEPGY